MQSTLASRASRASRVMLSALKSGALFISQSTLAFLSLPPPTQRDGTSSLDLYGSKTWMLHLFPPILCFGLLLTAIVLGLRRQPWALEISVIFGVEVSPEVQIIFIGLINKILDVAVQAVLEHMSLLYNTLWMVQPKVGATMQDALLKDEMVKPWKAVEHFYGRYRVIGFRKSSPCRLFITIVISICVILLGASLNTVGWPKRRWYPDIREPMLPTNDTDGPLTIHAPLMTLEHIDWAEEMRIGLALVGGVPQLDEDGLPVQTTGAADEIAGTLSASTAFFSLTRLPGMYKRSPPDWLSVWDTDMYLTGMQTVVNGSTVQSVSVQSQRVTDLFTAQKLNGTYLAKFAAGFHGIFRMTLPFLTTICTAPSTDSPPDNDLEILQPEHDGSATFFMHIGPSGGLNFPGASCTLKLSQVLFPVESWIVDHERASMAVSNINATPAPLPITTASNNARIAAKLASHLQSIVPMLHGQVPSFGVVPHLVLAARTLMAQHANFTSESAALAPIVAALAQHQLSTAGWTMRTHGDIMIPSSPVNWELFGSGPRMQWEWITIAVLFIMLLVMVKQVLLLALYRVQPGSWLELGGMLRAAYSTAKSSVSLSSVDKVRSNPSYKPRKEIAERANYAVYVQVRPTTDKWPELFERPFVDNWAMKNTRSRHQQAFSMSGGAAAVPSAPLIQDRLTSSNATTPTPPKMPAATQIPTLIIPATPSSSPESTTPNTQTPSPATSASELISGRPL